VIVVLAVAVGALFAGGTYLLLQRTLTRIVLGLMLLGHGVNVLLLLAGGRRGEPALLGQGVAPADVVDPMPQAMALTAIVITFAIVAFLLAMAYRSWTLSGDDEAEDDIEDRRIAELVHHDEHGDDVPRDLPSDDAEWGGRE
jgi:multicomponent Na+:H+ antiporter subunit C